MSVNEEEIPGVSDVSPFTPNQKKINSKKPLNELLKAIPPCSNYTPVKVHERKARPNLPIYADPNKPIDLYDLYISRHHRVLIASHTNINANLELQKLPRNHRRPWHDTNEWEVGVFLGILLLMGLDHSPAFESYWNCSPIKPIYIEIQKAMSLVRFEQIRRFLKISDPLHEADSLGPNWWKKLEPLVTDLQKASQDYYLPGPHISIDEQLILFKGRSRHSLKMVAKVAGQGFKLYSLCEGNYLLGFLFTSKVSGKLHYLE